jgi:hypothetical protein
MMISASRGGFVAIILASLWGLLAGLSRPNGFLLSVPLGLLALQQVLLGAGAGLSFPALMTLAVANALFVGLLAGFVPLGVLIDLTSMGTLVAFTVVSIGVMILRRTQPDLPRGFRVPFYPITPILSAAFALYIISQLPYSTFALFAVWLGVAAIIYFTYSMRHSRLGRGQVDATEEPR